jgi:Methyltransferase domain
VTQQLRSAPPNLHGRGDAYFGLAWPALEWLEQTLRPEMTTLETGSGASSIVFAAAGSAHTVISPAADEHERIRSWCEENGMSTARVEFIAASSDTALVGSWTPEPLDLVLVDGAHLFPFPVLDWFFTARHLRIGGRVVLDDAFLPSVNMVVRFLRASPSWEFEGALSYRTVCFRKLDENVGYDATGHRFDRVPRFGYLPPAARAVAYARHLLVDRSRLGQRALARLRR